jgi:biopolymer transport protein ExbB
LLNFFIKGGVVMIPLLFCSVLALIIIIERLIFYSTVNRGEEQEMKILKLYVLQGRLNEARSVTADWQSVLGRMADFVLKQQSHTDDRAGLESALQIAGDVEIKRLQRGLGILDTVVTASPLLGLLGTVTGIIRTFNALSAATGSAQASQLSMGIAEALYTTAFGLSIAIPALFFLNAFYGIAEKQAHKLSMGAQELLSVLTETPSNR